MPVVIATALAHEELHTILYILDRDCDAKHQKSEDKNYATRK